MNTLEYNFDGLIGPTHHYGGLAAGNLASQEHKAQVSNPRAAALEGLAKMKLLADLGVPQGVLPPHPRPHWEFLERHGFRGSEASILEQAGRERPDLLSIAYSSSFMWAANAATVSPGADTGDGRIHFTPANLLTMPHRALESPQTTATLRKLFSSHRHFSVYDPLPADSLLADEGAANQLRLCPAHGQPGLEVFVYGVDRDDHSGRFTTRFPARQSRQAFERIAALHELPEERRLFVQQNPRAIDAGAFHNDVVAVSNENVLLCHEDAFVDQSEFLNHLRLRFPGELSVIEVSAAELSLEETVKTYLFNSQLLSLPARPGTSERGMLLLSPRECEHHPRARAVIDRILREDNPVSDVKFVDVRQSMMNGGGPACLRLRIVMNDLEREAVQGNVFLNEALYRRLVDWVTRHYRDRLMVQDLADPQLAEESRNALAELYGILEI